MATDGPDIVELLHEQHTAVRELLSMAESQPAGTSLQAHLIGQCISLLIKHSATEEQLVYPRLRHLAASEGLVEHELAEHDEAEQLAADILDLELASPAYSVKLHELAEAVRSHIEDEESNAFPLLRRLPLSERQQMGTAFSVLHRVAPSRPHPKAPNTPPINLVTGPTLAAFDKLRDAVGAVRRGGS